MFDLRWGQTKPPLGVQINQGHPLTKGLVGCWLMNEGCGPMVYDLSGNGNHGTASGMTGISTSGWNPGKFGPALAFDGADDDVNCGTCGGTIFRAGNPITISAWINPRGAGEGNRGRIVEKATSTNGPTFRMFAANAINFKIACPIQNLTRQTVNGSITLNTTQHIVVTWDGSRFAANVHIYKNGLELAYATSIDAWTSNFADNSGADLLIGNNSTGAYTFAGTIDNVLIYNRVLSQIEVQRITQSPFAMFDQRRIWAVAGGVTYNDACTESVSTGESLGSILSLYPVVSESATTGEAVGSILSMYPAISESSAIGEAVVGALTMYGGLSESVSISDLASAIQWMYDGVSESSAAADVVAASLTILGQLSESVTASDAVSAILNIIGGITESSTAGDSASATLSIYGAIAEALAASDLATSQAVLNAAISENVTVEEALSAFLVMLASVSESASIEDLCEILADVIRAVFKFRAPDQATQFRAPDGTVKLELRG